ncbi:MAG: hypothetical protein HC868_13575 [Sphingomonadales bacterium]|nr:hypothetical protein [Sphingomonadales bacterium]
MFSYFRTKLRHGWRSKEATKETVSTTPPVTSTANTKTTTRPVVSGLIQDAPDVRTLAPTVVSKLPDVVASASTKNESTSDNGMSRLGGPRQPSDEDDKADARGASKSKTQKKDDGSGDGQAKPGERKLGRRVVSDLLPPAGTFRQNEILAINMKPHALAKALQRNFKVLEKIEYPALSLTITRLATPDTQNAIIGRTALHEELPTEGFVLNHLYLGGRLAAPASGGPDFGGGAIAPVYRLHLPHRMHPFQVARSPVVA